MAFEYGAQTGPPRTTIDEGRRDQGERSTEKKDGGRSPGPGKGNQSKKDQGTGKMRILKLVCLSIIQFFKQVWLLPQTVASGFRQARQKGILNELEAERLDRIRNPSKYLGK
jgi:hypothetical protein